MPVVSPGVGTLIALVVCVVGAVAAVLLIRKRWRFTDTPTSDAAHVFPGIGEVHGVVEAIGAPPRAASDQEPCVWWHYKVERQVKRDKSTDWVTEEEGVTAVPFHVRDASGVVRVVFDDRVSVSRAGEHDIEHLSLDFLRPHALLMKKTYDTGGGGFLGLFGSNESNERIADFHGTWRAKERRLLVGDHVFITAHARLVDSGAAVELAPTDADGTRRTFEVTVGDESAAKSSHANAWVIALAAVASVAGGVIFGAQVGGALAMAGGLVVATLAVFVVGAYNRVHRARNRGEFAWSLIDVACDQRADTIPALQAVVGAAMAHEQHVLAAVASVRGLGRRPTAAAAEAVRDSDDASHQLVARLEANPNLTTQQNTAQLIEQLRLLNDRVAFGRRFYNDSVNRLADRLTQFPDSLIAAAARVQPLPLLDKEALS
jgi:LemA protein